MLVIGFSYAQEYPRELSAIWTSISPVLGRKSLNNIDFKGRQIISLPGTPTWLWPALVTAILERKRTVQYTLFWGVMLCSLVKIQRYCHIRDYSIPWHNLKSHGKFTVLIEQKAGIWTKRVHSPSYHVSLTPMLIYRKFLHKSLLMLQM